MEHLGREGIFDDTKETIGEKEFEKEKVNNLSSELDLILNSLNIEEEKEIIYNAVRFFSKN